MKYSAKQINNPAHKDCGKWAVFTGKKYYPYTLSDNKEYATEQALILSMQWYNDQMDKCWSEIATKAESTGRGDYNQLRLLEKDGTPAEGLYGLTERGDLLC